MRLVGELDVAAASQLTDVLSEVHPEQGAYLAVDVSELTFMDARGLDVLASVHSRLLADGKSGIVVWGASGIVRRVFEITKMAALLQARGPKIGNGLGLPGMLSLMQALEQARRESGLSVGGLYVDYFALGGTASPAAMAAYLNGDLDALDRHQRDITTHAMNEYLVALGHQELVLSYSSELERSGISPS